MSREALALYMRFTYVPAPHSIYRGFTSSSRAVCSVSAVNRKNGRFSAVRPPATGQGITLRRWWSLADVVEAGAKNQIVDEQEALTVLEARLGDAVRLQSVADVPLGAFLSGGVDSSAIVALMQEQSARPVKTFTVGFEEAGFNESPHARAVAQHLGTDHSELFVTANEAQTSFHLPAMYDEPFADSSQIPTHSCAARRASRSRWRCPAMPVMSCSAATTAISGGRASGVAWPGCLPGAPGAGQAIAGCPWRLGRPAPAQRLLPGSRGIARVGDKAHKLAARLRGVHNIEDL